MMLPTLLYYNLGEYTEGVYRNVPQIIIKHIQIINCLV
jgi:hypothetical protein